MAEPVIEIIPPSTGNIKPVPDEETDPDTFGPNIHTFPDRDPPATRFEDFNRRLFILTAYGGTGIWPNTNLDDYPTRIAGMSVGTAKEEIHLRLRMRYPVILDTYGYWANASALLEQNPDYTDEFVSTYLTIPEAQRPVVVSVQPFQKDGKLTFIRYGFEDYTLALYSMRFHLAACLTLLMQTMTGPRDGWLWLSVARMRQTVIRAFQASEAKRLENETMSYLEQQTLQAKRHQDHQNRFVSLWKNRVIEAEKTSEDEAQSAPDESPQVAEAAQ